MCYQQQALKSTNKTRIGNNILVANYQGNAWDNEIAWECVFVEQNDQKILK